jgi:hypothetical protein
MSSSFCPSCSCSASQIELLGLAKRQDRADKHLVDPQDLEEEARRVFAHTTI